MVCNDCRGHHTIPQCVSSCPISTPPVPLQAKKGRCKVSTKAVIGPKLFPNGKNHPFASAIAIWEATNVLSQRHSLPWETDESGHLCYQRQVSGGKGKVTFRVTDTLDPAPPVPLAAKAAKAAISTWDIRATCLHLIFAAHATTLEQPWEQSFTINDQQISDYLGLEKRKDLNKLAKLTLIKELVHQPCKLQVDIDWAQQGRMREMAIANSRLWHLVETQHHFQEDELGCKHLSGLTFQIRAGQWTQYFLNQQGARQGTAFYQYGNLPKSLLGNVMSIWQQHEGAARIMVWLLFKTRMGVEQRITVPTLMRIAYGEEKLTQASSHREERKRLVRTFESDLEQLNHLGLKPIFDSLTYPADIQPFWAKLHLLPDDAEAALEFWTTDGSNQSRLTDAAPRDKWHRLMHARLLQFELPADWVHSASKATKKRTRKPGSDRPPAISALSGQQILAARKSRQISQRTLANELGKSQSWVRDIESGRLQATEKDRMLLSKVLGIV